MVWMFSCLPILSRNVIEVFTLLLNQTFHGFCTLEARIIIPIAMKNMPVRCVKEIGSLNAKCPARVVPTISAPAATGKATERGYSLRITNHNAAPEP